MISTPDPEKPDVVQKSLLREHSEYRIIKKKTCIYAVMIRRLMENPTSTGPSLNQYGPQEGRRQRIVATIGKLPGFDKEERIGWDRDQVVILSGKPQPAPRSL